ncbi:Fur family transcriptional regulator [Leucobacter sp. GX24907]
METTRTRRTAQGAAVRTALEKTEGFISAQQLHRRLIDDGMQVGIATVYRQLNSLVTAQEADTITTVDGQLYRACENLESHHHHMVCEVCGKAVEIAPPDEAWFASVAEQHGFTVTSHIVEVFGVCAECRAAGRTAAHDSKL